MTTHLKHHKNKIRTAFLGIFVLAVSGIGQSAVADVVRPFKSVKITIDMSRGGDILESESSFTDPKAIKDKTFIELDLKVIVDDTSAKNVLKIADQGISDEPSGCRPGHYNPLDMEDGLRYFFQLRHKNENIQATIYPGERSRNPYNDVFCEFNPKHGGVKKAVLRIRGFFFVRHSQISENGIDVQLRPIVPTPTEVGNYLTAQ